MLRVKRTVLDSKWFIRQDIYIYMYMVYNIMFDGINIRENGLGEPTIKSFE